MNKARPTLSHLHIDCLFNSLYTNNTKTSRTHITGALWRGPAATGGFPPQRFNKADSIFMSWRYHSLNSPISQRVPKWVSGHVHWVGKRLSVHSPPFWHWHACTPEYDEKRKRSLQWRHNDQDSVSNHQPHGCLLNRLYRRRSKKTSKLRVTGLCVGNSPGLVNSPHKGQLRGKCFHLMTSSCVVTRAGFPSIILGDIKMVPTNTKICYIYGLDEYLHAT